MKLYLAGPMSGIPQFNFPAFDREAFRLRADGHDVVSPAELDDPATRHAAMASDDGAATHVNGHSWGDLLARDVKMIANECEGVVVMNGWQRSRGARLETFVGRLCGLPVFRIDGSRIGLLRLLVAWGFGR